MHLVTEMQIDSWKRLEIDLRSVKKNCLQNQMEIVKPMNSHWDLDFLTGTKMQIDWWKRSETDLNSEKEKQKMTDSRLGFEMHLVR
jgi:hypothetical protein